MTCREKLKIEHPDEIDEKQDGGCWGCPADHGYLPDPEYCNFGNTDCTMCWDREIPGTAPAPQIKDSGDRRQFYNAEGKPLAVRDMSEGKGRMDLLPWGAIIEVSKHAENGSKKYGEHNVDKGIPTHSLCDSGMRHLAKYLDGWDDEPHLLAAAWNLLWAIQMELKHPELVDTPFVQNDNNKDEE